MQTSVLNVRPETNLKVVNDQHQKRSFYNLFDSKSIQTEEDKKRRVESIEIDSHIVVEQKSGRRQQTDKKEEEEEESADLSDVTFEWKEKMPDIEMIDMDNNPEWNSIGLNVAHIRQIIKDSKNKTTTKECIPAKDVIDANSPEVMNHQHSVDDGNEISGNEGSEERAVGGGGGGGGGLGAGGTVDGHHQLQNEDTGGRNDDLPGDDQKPTENAAGGGNGGADDGNDDGGGGGGDNGDGSDEKTPPGSSEEPMEQDEEIRSEAIFQFRINNFSAMKDTMLSEPTYVRNLPWRIMAMPRFNQNGEKGNRSLGLFLQCNGDSESTSWSCQASASLRLIAQNPKGTNLERKIEHLFYAKENDWGFVHFVSWGDIINPEKGYLKDDSIVLEVHVQADAPHGVQWDSKKHTGYIGLKNQGATCYMNSLLQTLFFTNKLRKAVYQMPTESDDSTRSVALALQRVFYELQFNDKPVGTKKLTKSFGWEAFDSFMQHDVQELCRVLLDNMESKMKGTCVEGTIPALFEGKMVSFIRCKNVDFCSHRVEPFYDIQLNVKGKKDIYESFDDYVAVEMLDGENKYDAGQFGMQEAEKGIIFSNFPPVLHLHLLRFQYDPLTDTNVKINDRFEFYEKIDLSKYLQDKSQKATYTLHAVLVHSGDNHGGHYVVFINPKGDGRWCKFDDDVVARSAKQEAINNNFGSVDDDASVKHCTNAYMLVYIRDGSDVLQPVTEDDIPDQLVERLIEERRREELRRKERNEASLYMHLHAYTECSFYGYQGNDLYDAEKTAYKAFKVKKTASLRTVYEQLGAELNYPPEGIRLWPIIRRQNETLRPTAISCPNELEREIDQIVEQDPVASVFLELIDPSNPTRTLPAYEKDSQTLLFLKYYDPINQFITYCGYTLMSISEKAETLIPLLNSRAGLPHDTPLLLYEEVRPDQTCKIEDLDQPLKLILNELTDGDIIVFQRADLHLGADVKLPTVVDFFKVLYNRVEVTFCDKSAPNDPGFVMELSKTMNYQQLATAVAERLDTDPYLIQFFKPQSYRDVPTTPLKFDFKGKLDEIFPAVRQKAPRKIFYQLLTIRINELEHKKTFKCVWVNSKLKEERELLLYPNKSGTVAELLEEAKKLVDLSQNEDGSGRLRLLEVQSNKIYHIFLEDMLLECINTNKTLRVEEIPREELELDANEYLMPVAHFQKEPMSTFGIPFLIKIRQKEMLSSIKERIQKKLDIPDKEFEKYKFAIVSGQKVQYFNNETDHPVCKEEYSLFTTNSSAMQMRPWLGLEHVNKAPKRSRYNHLEKAIKIHN